MADMPLVSVAIPCYNHESYVQECIQSVIDQNYDNIELIIIDDGSSDNSIEKIKEMIPACEERFINFSFRHRSNIGLSATLNEAIEWCTGDYFSAIASDDIMYPLKTSTLVPYLEQDKMIAGVFSNCNLIDSSGSFIGTTSSPDMLYHFDDILLRQHQIIAPSQLLRIDYIKAAGCYQPDMYIEDWYMWLALTEKGDALKVVDAVLVGYRQHDSSMQKNALKMYHSRKKIISYFDNEKRHHYCKKSMAIICLMASIDFTSISKIKSCTFLIKGIVSSRHIIFILYFYETLLRILIPRRIIVWAKGNAE